MLDRERRRHFGMPFQIQGPVIDPLVLDKAADPYRRGSRRLVDVCKHHGVPLSESDAHSAAGDATASLRLAVVLGREFEVMADGNLADLHRYQIEQYRLQRQSFHAHLRRKGEEPRETNTVWPMAPHNGEVS
jgi:DNA polymerase-3 subunit epsilon